MIVTIVDTETTGIKSADRIIEICMAPFEIDDFSGEVIKTYKPYIQRIDPQRPIHEEAYKVHGIGPSDLIGKPKFSEIIHDVTAILKKTDLLVAHNIEFDATYLLYEYEYAGQEMPNVELFCTMEHSRFATPYGKPPNLGELCFAFNVDYSPEEAHSASYDVNVLKECFVRGVKNKSYQILKEVVEWPI